MLNKEQLGVEQYDKRDLKQNIIEGFDAVQDNSIQNNTILYNIIQYSTVQYNTMQYNNTIKYCTYSAK